LGSGNSPPFSASGGIAFSMAPAKVLRRIRHLTVVHPVLFREMLKPMKAY
jgi:hypothetical protein